MRSEVHRQMRHASWPSPVIPQELELAVARQVEDADAPERLATAAEDDPEETVAWRIRWRDSSWFAECQMTNGI